jgi:hypothetical protein
MVTARRAVFFNPRFTLLKNKYYFSNNLCDLAIADIYSGKVEAVTKYL